MTTIRQPKVNVNIIPSSEAAQNTEQKILFVGQYSVPTDDVAFRDIDLTLGLDVGTETFNTLIDLDNEPL